MRTVVPLGIIALALSSCGLTNDLNLKVQSNEGGQLFITNAGSTPIKIQDLTVNGRKDCTMARDFGGFVDKPFFVKNAYASDSLFKNETVNSLQIIFAWSDLNDPFIEEHVSESARHQQWVWEAEGSRYRFVEKQDGNYHANICYGKQTNVTLYYPSARPLLAGEPHYDPSLKPPLVSHAKGCQQEGQRQEELRCVPCERSDIRRLSYDLKFDVVELQVGDSIKRSISCAARIVNATVTTDRGSKEYRWQ